MSVTQWRGVLAISTGTYASQNAPVAWLTMADLLRRAIWDAEAELGGEDEAELSVEGEESRSGDGFCFASRTFSSTNLSRPTPLFTHFIPSFAQRPQTGRARSHRRDVSGHSLHRGGLTHAFLPPPASLTALRGRYSWHAVVDTSARLPSSGVA
jgi:hypothetical protein